MGALPVWLPPHIYWLAEDSAAGVLVPRLGWVLALSVSLSLLPFSSVSLLIAPPLVISALALRVVALLPALPLFSPTLLASLCVPATFPLSPLW